MSDNDDQVYGDDAQGTPPPTSPLVDLDPNVGPQPQPQQPGGSRPSSRVTSPQADQAEGGAPQQNFRFGAGTADAPGSASFNPKTPPKSPFSPGGARTDKTPPMKPRKAGERDEASGSPNLRPSQSPSRKSIFKRRTGSGSDMVVETVASKQIVLQQTALAELIAFIKQDPSRVFNSSRVYNTEYQYFSENRARNLHKFFHELYRQGFNKFDSQTNDIFQTYITYCARVFDEVAIPTDKDDFSTQARFLTISICFGIDRALTGLKLKDDLFREFKIVPQDNFHSEMYDKAELVQKVPELPLARELYYDFFRNDSFNPLVNPRIPIVGPKGVSYRDITHHGYLTPVQNIRFSQMSPFFPHYSPRDGEHEFNYNYTGSADPQNNPGTGNPGDSQQQHQQQ